MSVPCMMQIRQIQILQAADIGVRYDHFKMFPKFLYFNTFDSGIKKKSMSYLFFKGIHLII